MLHWQLKNLKNLPWLNNLINKISNKQNKIAHDFTDNLNLFIATSCIVHIFLGLFLFVFSTSHQPDLTALQVRANAQNVKVRLVPFGSTLSKGLHRGSKKAKISKTSKKSNSRSALRSTKKIELPENNKLATTQVAKTEPVQEQKKAPTLLKSTTLKKAIPKKSKGAKKKSKKIIQKMGTLKNEDPVKTLPQPIMPQISLIKKPKHAQVIPEPIKTPEEPETIQKIDQTEPTIDTTKIIDQTSDSEEDILYVDYKELEALQLGGALQEAVTGVWNPPAGMGDEVECKVRIALNHDGKLLTTTYEQISGIRIYDATVERAVPKIEFPHQLWGKSFVICFKT